MFYTPPSRFAPPTYRKKLLSSADQPPGPAQTAADEAAAQAELRQQEAAREELRLRQQDAPDGPQAGQQAAQRPLPYATMEQRGPAAEIPAGRTTMLKPGEGVRKMVARHEAPGGGKGRSYFLEGVLPRHTIPFRTKDAQAVKRSTDGCAEAQRQDTLMGRMLRDGDAAPPGTPGAGSAQEAAERERLLRLSQAGQGDVKPQPHPQAQAEALPTASPAAEANEYDPKAMAAFEQAEAETKAEVALQRRREDRRAKLASEGRSGAARSLDALEDQMLARRAELEKKFPQRGPEYEAGLQALREHVQQQQSQIHSQDAQIPEIAAKIYQQWGKGVAGNWITGAAPQEDDEYSPGAPLSSTHLEVLEQEAARYGVDAKDLRHHLEMQRLGDWSRASTSSANRKQEHFGESTLRSLAGRGPAEPARVLPDGRIIVNPALGEDQATFNKAIDNSSSNPEAREAARKMWPEYHERWLSTAREKLETGMTLPGVENYHEWRVRNLQAGKLSQEQADGRVAPVSQNEMARRYLDEMKGRSGLRKLADNVSTSLVSGGGQVVSGLLGAQGLAKNTFQDLTGIDIGGQADMEAAADMARQNQALTQSHELTGTIDGAGGRLLSGVVQAVPSVGVGVATGGGSALALGAAQSAGSTYTDLYEHHLAEGKTPEEAHRAAAGTAIASGGVSLLLSKVMPGGAQALNNPATRETAKKGFGTAIKSFFKGAAEEVPQEVIDGGFNHIASEMNKGRSFQEAATSYAAQFPESILTAALLGGGVQAAADHHGGSAETPQTQAEKNMTPVGYGDPAATPRSGQWSAPSAPQPLPQTTTQDGPGSGQQLQTTVNNPALRNSQSEGGGQPPQTSASPIPAPAATLQEVGQVRDSIERLKAKAKDSELGLEEQRELDHNEKVMAHTRVRNLEKEQQVIRGLPKPRELDPHKTQALAEARAVLGRPVPGEPATSTPSTAGSSSAVPHAPSSPQPQIAQNTTRNGAASDQPPQTTANNRQPGLPRSSPVLRSISEEGPQTSAFVPPSGPPLSLETSQKLIHNVMNRPPQARSHPTTQADLAQAQRVVQQHVQKLERQGGALSVGQRRELADARAALGRLGAVGTVGTVGTVSATQTQQSNPPSGPYQADTMRQAPIPPKVPLSSSNSNLTPEQRVRIPHITQTAKTLLAKLTAAHVSQFQNLKNPISESADVCDLTQSSMWLNEDFSIAYHLPTLAAEMAIHNDHAILGHIETRFNNLLQASPEYNSLVQKTAPQNISQSGMQPGGDSPKTFATVEIGIKPHLKEWGRIDGEIHQWESDLDRVTETNDTLAMDRIQTRLDALEVQRQGLVDQVHRLLEVPSGMRTPFAFVNLTPTTRTAAIRGAALAERYIHPDLLPKMGAVDFNSKRAGQFRGMLLINRLSNPSSVLHEIAHGVEEQSQNVRDKCIAFLKRRAGNEKPQQLSQLEGDKTYTSDEVAYEDEFASRGGRHYMGKVYPNGTEILTMGIERLHADPIEFYVNDPEYFAFVINTLQHP